MYETHDHNMYTGHDLRNRVTQILKLRDGLDEYHELEIEAAVRSGDYFETLATLLDALEGCPELQSVAHELRYLQKNYRITKL